MKKWEFVLFYDASSSEGQELAKLFDNKKNETLFICNNGDNGLPALFVENKGLYEGFTSIVSCAKRIL